MIFLRHRLHCVVAVTQDPRQHSSERVFAESWKPLQGPALCVYNNKPFSDADIEGMALLPLICDVTYVY